MRSKSPYVANAHNIPTNHLQQMIMADLQSLRPFKEVDGRRFESFCDISHNHTSSFDQDAFVTWVRRQKRNILKHFPVFKDDLEEDASSEND